MIDNPRVAYVGNFSQRHCTEVHIARELRYLNCEVLELQEDVQTPGSIEREVHDFGADLVLYTRTWGKPQSLTDVWRRLEAHGIVTASYHLDLYLGLRRQTTLEGDPFWSTQWVFTPDGDPNSAETFASMGINHVWSPPGVVHDECVPGVFDQALAHDVVFVGSETYHNEWPWRGQLLAWLRRYYSGRYARYGGDVKLMRNEDLNNLYASAGVAIGDSLCLRYTHQNYWSDRVCETLGRGGVLLHPEVPGLRDTLGLVDGEHCRFYTYQDFEGIRAAITDLLADPAEARAMAARGQRHIAAHHTYLDRLAVALHVMGLRESPERPSVIPVLDPA